MKMIIDIPENQYTTLNAKTQDDIVDVIDHGALIKAIKNGTPLPEGHGRLIDVNDLKTLFGLDDRLWWDNAVEKFTDLPTIIEADKEGEQE